MCFQWGRVNANAEFLMPGMQAAAHESALTCVKRRDHRTVMLRAWRNVPDISTFCYGMRAATGKLVWWRDTR
jgi:hypothetical protein